MTKKDYVKIAKVLKDKRDLLGPQETWTNEDKRHFAGFLQACDMLIESFADMLAEDNPRFDREKFIRACGIE